MTTQHSKSAATDTLVAPAKRRRGRAIGRGSWFAAGMIVGIVAATVTSVHAQLAEGKPDLQRLANYLAAIDNVVIGLAVDTERSAIGVANLNERLAGLERRVKSLESRAAD